MRPTMLRHIRLIWVIFQTLGFVGLFFGQDQGSHAAVWNVLVAVGFGIGLPAACFYFVLWFVLKRRGVDHTHV